MPLKARYLDKDIFSFQYDESSWRELKNHDVVMHCCGSKAILKKSKLGTFFFSHSRKGECTSSPETAEHLYLKNLVALIAQREGWQVVTEFPGATPDGEQWVADVYCEKGGAKLAIEIQWSPQTKEEFQRRQKKYSESGIRAAWLYRLRGNKEYWFDDLPHGHATPVFGMRVDAESKIRVPQFGVSVDEFVEGLLCKQVQWSPRHGEELLAKLTPHYETCWKCKRKTGMVLSLELHNSSGIEIGSCRFDEEGIPELITKHVSSGELAAHSIGVIKYRHSKTRSEAYLSNGCVHCDALQGNHFLGRAMDRYRYQNPPDPVLEFRFMYEVSMAPLNVDGSWYFKGIPGELSF